MDAAHPQTHPHSDSPQSSLAPDALYRSLGGPHCPLIIDVRKAPAFDRDPSMLPGALRVHPDAIDEWTTPTHSREVVVYCVHGHEVSQNAARALAARGHRASFLEGGITLWREIGLPVMQKSERFGIPSTTRGTRWITRERPKPAPQESVGFLLRHAPDRIACPWLVRRFIDPRAEFLYVPTSTVLAEAERIDAIAYDIPGAPLEHDGDQCSFDAFIKAFALRDPALDDLATIVRAADTGRPERAPQAHGLLAVSLGLSHNFADDHAMLEHGFVLYDALYAWCRHARDERHNWTPQPVASA